MNFKDNLDKRYGVKGGLVDWFALERYGAGNSQEFEKPKLIYPSLASHLFTVFDDKDIYPNNKCFIITSNEVNLKFLSVLLSSKTTNFIFKFLGAPLQGKYFDLNKNYVKELPIFLAKPEEQQPFVEKADQMIQLNQELQNEVNGFKHWIQKEFNVERLPKKLERYYKLSEDEFIDELRKKKVETKSRKNRENLEREFNESQAIVNPLLMEIKRTDDEIDKMVYKLYNLTEEEIKIIEDIMNSEGG